MWALIRSCASVLRFTGGVSAGSTGVHSRGVPVMRVSSKSQWAAVSIRSSASSGLGRYIVLRPFIDPCRSWGKRLFGTAWFSHATGRAWVKSACSGRYVYPPVILPTATTDCPFRGITTVSPVFIASLKAHIWLTLLATWGFVSRGDISRHSATSSGDCALSRDFIIPKPMVRKPLSRASSSRSPYFPPRITQAVILVSVDSDCRLGSSRRRDYSSNW